MKEMSATLQHAAPTQSLRRRPHRGFIHPASELPANIVSLRPAGLYTVTLRSSSYIGSTYSTLSAWSTLVICSRSPSFPLPPPTFIPTWPLSPNANPPFTRFSPYLLHTRDRPTRRSLLLGTASHWTPPAIGPASIPKHTMPVARQACPSGQLHWTCELNSTVENRFAGCCASNPCHSNGLCDGVASPPASSATPSATATPAATRPATTKNAQQTRDPSEWFASPAATTAAPPAAPAGSTTAVTVGAAVGAVLLLFALGAGWYLWRLRRREKEAWGPGGAPTPLTLVGPAAGGGIDSGAGVYVPAVFSPPPVAETDAGLLYGGGAVAAKQAKYGYYSDADGPAELPTVRLEPVEMAAGDLDNRRYDGDGVSSWGSSGAPRGSWASPQLSESWGSPQVPQGSWSSHQQLLASVGSSSPPPPPPGDWAARRSTGLGGPSS